MNDEVGIVARLFCDTSSCVNLLPGEEDIVFIGSQIEAKTFYVTRESFVFQGLRRVCTYVFRYLTL